MIRWLVAAILVASVSTIDAKIYRSAAAIAEFKRLQPCPSTGKTRGACPGWQIDHVMPLKCKGDDHHLNMQWLTIQAHKEKTARESAWCRR
ncbi:MAG: HNH endonuclease signature motif containing protein [Sterolibacterium sp.]